GLCHRSDRITEAGRGRLHRHRDPSGGGVFDAGRSVDRADAAPRRRRRCQGFGVKAAGVLIAIALALALQTTLARFMVGGTAAIDMVLIVVVYVALTLGPVTG